VLSKEFPGPLEISQKEFARHLGWSYARLNQLVNGRRNVSADSASAFGDALVAGAVS